MPDDVSPLQLGVRGRVGARSFELIGRVRWRYADGAWNEWLAYFDDGSTGWLGESSGRYMLLRQVETSRHVGRRRRTAMRSGEHVRPGTEAMIDGVEYMGERREDRVVRRERGRIAVQLARPDRARAST